jgi:hypothetical protein
VPVRTKPFEQMVLVLLDLSSGYIFVEAQAKDRGYQTWQALVQQALGPAVEVKYLVSDRAKALVKLALEVWVAAVFPTYFMPYGI